MGFRISVGLILFLIGLPSQAALQTGEALFSGGGCGAAKSLKMRQQDANYVLQIPIHLTLKKEKKSSLLRKTCNFRLSLKPRANEKIVLREYAQSVEAQVSRLAELQYTVNTTFVGQKTESLELQIKAISQDIRRQEELKSRSLSLESKCGQPLMLAVNSSAFTKSAGEVSLKSADLKVSLRVVSCR